jgi:hypothetical protein
MSHIRTQSSVHLGGHPAPVFLTVDDPIKYYYAVYDALSKYRNKHGKLPSMIRAGLDARPFLGADYSISDTYIPIAYMHSWSNRFELI